MIFHSVLLTPIVSRSFSTVVTVVCFIQGTHNAEWHPLQIISLSVWPSLEIKHSPWRTKVSTPVISLYFYLSFCHAHNTWIPQRQWNNGFQHIDTYRYLSNTPGLSANKTWYSIAQFERDNICGQQSISCISSHTVSTKFREILCSFPEEFTKHHISSCAHMMFLLPIWLLRRIPQQ